MSTCSAKNQLPGRIINAVSWIVASHHSAPVSDPLLRYSSDSSDNCHETRVFLPLRDPPLVPSESLVATFFPLALCLGEMLAPSCHCWEDNYPKSGMLEHIPGRAGEKRDLRSTEVSPTPLWRWAHHISDFGTRSILRGRILLFSLAGPEEGAPVETHPPPPPIACFYFLLLVQNLFLS